MSFSAHGHYVFSYSSADDLTDDDLNRKADIVRYDVVRGSRVRVLMAARGWKLDGHCFVPVATTGDRFTLSCESGVAEGANAAVRDIFAVGPLEGGLPPAKVGLMAAAVAEDGPALDAEQIAVTAAVPGQTAGPEPGGSWTAAESIPQRGLAAHRRGPRISPGTARLGPANRLGTSRRDAIGGGPAVAAERGKEKGRSPAPGHHRFRSNPGRFLTSMTSSPTANTRKPCSSA